MLYNNIKCSVKRSVILTSRINFLSIHGAVCDLNITVCPRKKINTLTDAPRKQCIASNAIFGI